MSDAPEGPGWWQASDSKWYPPQAGQPQPPSAGFAPAGAPGPQRTEGYAVASLVAGVLGWTLLPCVGGIAAVVLGHVARRRIRSTAGLAGGGMAVAGLVLGYLQVALVALGVLAGVVVFAVGGVNNDSDTAACRIELRTLQTAVEAYRAETGNLPASEDDLVPRYLEAPAERYDFTVDGTTVTYRPASPDCPAP